MHKNELIPSLNQSPDSSLEDPRIPWLRHLCDKNAIAELLSKHFEKDLKELKTLEMTPLAHVASMRATFLYRMSLVNGKTVEWIAKTSTSKQPERVYANYWAIWNRAGSEISIPKPIGFLLNPPLTLQEKVDGIRLGAVVDDPRFPSWISDLAKALAKLHGLDIPIRGTRDLAQEEKNFNRWKNLLIQIRPDLKKHLQTLGDRILQGFSQTFSMQCLIHADFHHTNILAGEKGITLIDLDEVAYGDPCIDVARFLSSLRLPSLRVFGSFGGLKTAREKFLDTYLAQREEDRKKIHLFEAAALFTSAASTFRLHRKNWSHEIDLFMDEIEHTLKKSESLTPSPSSPHGSISKQNHSDWATKEEYIRTLLSPHIFQRFGNEICSCCLIKEENKRNYRILHYLLGISEREESISIELFIHSEKKESFLLQAINSTNEKLKKEGIPIRLQEPVAYFPEIRAAAFYAIHGRSLKKELAYSDPIQMGQKLAQGIRLVEKSAGPLYFKHFSIKELFVCDSLFYLHFTVPKTKKPVLFNREHFERQIKLYGTKNKGFENAQKCLEAFKKSL